MEGDKQFFANTFLHAVNIFDLLHSFNEQNRIQNNAFLSFTNFHSFIAANIKNPILQVNDGTLIKNATFYSFLLSSDINTPQAVKVPISYQGTPPNPKDLTLHSYMIEGDTVRWVYVYFSNKTQDQQALNVHVNSIDSQPIAVETKYIQAEALHSSANGQYTFNPKNVTVSSLQTNPAFNYQSIQNTSIPPMSFGFIRMKYKKGSLEVVDSPERINVIHLVPNPANSMVTFSLPSANHRSMMKVNIYTPKGRIVKSVSLHTDNNTATIDISRLPVGMYFLQIIDNLHGSYLTKMVKN